MISSVSRVHKQPFLILKKQMILAPAPYEIQINSLTEELPELNELLMKLKWNPQAIR